MRTTTTPALYRLASRGLPRLPFRDQRADPAARENACPGRAPAGGSSGRERGGRRRADRVAGPPRADQGVLVYLHGGSYVTGPVPGQWRWLSAVSRQVPMAAVMVDYRLAPEHPHPAALDDATAALASLRSARVLRPGGWALMGDSAGGALAIAAAQTLVAGGRPLPAALVLCAPWIDLTLSNPRIPDTEPDDPVLSREFLRPSATAYAGRARLNDRALSPLNADLAGLPPVHLSTGTRDMLVHDARLLRERLRKAGVPVDHLEEVGALHAYPTLTAGPAFYRAVAAQAAFLREHMSRPAGR